MRSHHQVNLGFSADPVPEGTHMCLIYTSQEERMESLYKFVLSGLEHHEKTSCFSSAITKDELKVYLEQNGVDFDECCSNKALTLEGTEEVYFKDGEFDPDRMLNMLREFHIQSKEESFTAARVIGEMTAEVEHVKGGERLLEYESRISLLVREHPVTSVCQYDANAFDGATLMQVLKVHPKMIVNGSVVENPFYIKPEEYLKNIRRDA